MSNILKGEPQAKEAKAAQRLRYGCMADKVNKYLILIAVASDVAGSAAFYEPPFDPSGSVL